MTPRTETHVYTVTTIMRHCTVFDRFDDLMSAIKHADIQRLDPDASEVHILMDGLPVL